MKTSITNKVIGSTVTSGVTPNAGEVASNIIDRDTGKVYGVNGNLNITITGLGDIDADMIGMFNVYFDANFVLSLYDSTPALIETQTFTSSDWTGWKYKNLLYEPTFVSSDLETIIITTTGSTIDKWIGYLWIGDWIDFGCCENIQPFSSTDDSIKIMLANNPDVNKKNRYRRFNITTNKTTLFSTVRDNFELVLDDGAGYGRPWYFDVEPPVLDELYFANLDSTEIGYDTEYTNGEYTAQTTIGMQEVK